MSSYVSPSATTTPWPYPTALHATCLAIHHAVGQNTSEATRHHRITLHTETYLRAHSAGLGVEACCIDLLYGLTGKRLTWPGLADMALPALQASLGVYIDVFISAQRLLRAHKPALLPPPSARAALPQAILQGALPPTPWHGASLPTRRTCGNSHALPSPHALPIYPYAGCPSPHLSRDPVLCRDGLFYEKMSPSGPNPAAHGGVPCTAYPHRPADHWMALARVVPKLCAMTQNDAVFAALAHAWLGNTADPALGPEPSFWSFCTLLDLTGPTLLPNGYDAPLPAPFVVQGLAVVHRIPPSDRQAFGYALRGLAHILSAESPHVAAVVDHVVRHMFPPQQNPNTARTDASVLPLSFEAEVALMQAKGTFNPQQVITARQAMTRLCTQRWGTNSAHRTGYVAADVNEVRGLIRYVAEAPPHAVMALLDVVDSLVGAGTPEDHATLQDCALLADTLVMMPHSHAVVMAQCLGAVCGAQGAVSAMWPSLTAILTIHTANRLALLHDIAPAAQRHGRGVALYNALLDAMAPLATETRQAFTATLSALWPQGEHNAHAAAQGVNALALLSTPQRTALHRGASIVHSARTRHPTYDHHAPWRLLTDANFLRTAALLAEGQIAHHVGSTHGLTPPRRRYRIDEENVMASFRTTQLLADAQNLKERLPEETRLSAPCAAAEIENYLLACAPTMGQRHRGADSEAHHALRALRHHTVMPAVSDLRMGDITAWVWQNISQHRVPSLDQTLTDRDAMRYALAWGLARCVEDDGHLTCFWGQGQRVIGALGGYGFSLSFEKETLRASPSDLLTQLSMAFMRPLGQDRDEPTADEVAHFCQQSLACAEQVLGNAGDIAHFTGLLRQYVSFSDWVVPRYL